ncbi:MAG: response regulator [Anaerolineales bacterium]|nr:response regulator [Anaerolineales bacterium]
MVASKHILLVEEQAEVAAILRAGLERLNEDIRVQVAPASEQALQAFQNTEFDLLIVDMALPGLSGLELMARGRKRTPQLKAILLSAEREAQAREQAARAGAEAFFFKPVELADLLDASERLLGLVGSFLPPEIQLSQLNGASVEQAMLSQLLGELQFNLQAEGIALFDQRGRVLAEAGNLPDNLQNELMPPLLSAHLAAGRIAAEGLQTFRIARRHLLLASLGRGHALLLVAQPLAAARLAAHAEAIEQCKPHLLAELERAEPRRSPALGDTTPTAPRDAKLEEVLDKAETKPTSRSQTDKYWKEQEVAPLPDAGTLSYEQAARLGLAPRG